MHLSSFQTEYPRALVVGGYTTGEKRLEPLSAELVASGRVPSGRIGRMSIYEALEDPDKLREASELGLLVVHSAGAVAAREALNLTSTSSYGRPADIEAWNSPEPTSRLALISPFTLIRRSVVKNAYHVSQRFRADEESTRQAHKEVLDDNRRQFFDHFVVNRRLIRTISGFSTRDFMRSVLDTGMRGRIVTKDNDEYFPPHKHYGPITDGVALDGLVRVLPGRHEDLLIQPRESLEQLRDNLAA